VRASRTGTVGIAPGAISQRRPAVSASGQNPRALRYGLGFPSYRHVGIPRPEPVNLARGSIDVAVNERLFRRLRQCRVLTLDRVVQRNAKKIEHGLRRSGRLGTPKHFSASPRSPTGQPFPVDLSLRGLSLIPKGTSNGAFRARSR